MLCNLPFTIRAQYAVCMVEKSLPPEAVEYFRAAAARRQRRDDLVCETCGTQLPPSLARRRFCSARCQVRAYRARQRAAAQTSSTTADA